MKKLMFILLATSLTAYEFTEYRDRPMPVPAEEPIKKSFKYMSMGVTAAPYFMELSAADISVGQRTLGKHIAVDGCVGTALQPYYQLLYGQVSLLVFPTPSEGVYFGAGVTGGVNHIGRDFGPWFNLPVTLGYQFGKENRVHFFQIQGTPLMTFTSSFGFSF